jgi:hypothetical protein
MRPAGLRWSKSSFLKKTYLDRCAGLARSK